MSYNSGLVQSELVAGTSFPSLPDKSLKVLDMATLTDYGPAAGKVWIVVGVILYSDTTSNTQFRILGATRIYCSIAKETITINTPFKLAATQKISCVLPTGADSVLVSYYEEDA